MEVKDSDMQDTEYLGSWKYRLSLITELHFEKLNYLLGLLKKENKNQKRKWGLQTHTPFEWLTYTTEELGELAKAISEYVYRKGTKQEIVKEAIQTATLALKIAEMYLEENNDKECQK